eukprot:gene18455-21998_t
MEKFSKLKELVAGVEADAEKFYNAGNGAAGTRVRKAMQDLKVLAQEIRTQPVMDHSDDKPYRKIIHVDMD